MLGGNGAESSRIPAWQSLVHHRSGWLPQNHFGLDRINVLAPVIRASSAWSLGGLGAAVTVSDPNLISILVFRCGSDRELIHRCQLHVRVW